MPIIEESKIIPGVYFVHLRSFQDDRGRFSEIFRKEWFPQRKWDVYQSNRSESLPNVIRGLHYHHHQVDYWHVVQGSIKAGLVDLRSSSATFGNSVSLVLNSDDNIGLFIPVGVAHGFLSITQATLIYIVDSYYDGNDEFGVAWNDPVIGLDWGVNNPLISERDRNNPLLKDIPPDILPP